MAKVERFMMQEPEMVRVSEEKGRDLNVQSGREGPAALGQGDAKLPAGADVELGEHLAQMPFPLQAACHGEHVCPGGRPCDVVWIGFGARRFGVALLSRRGCPGSGSGCRLIAMTSWRSASGC